MTSTAEQSRRYREKHPERWKEASRRAEFKRRGTRSLYKRQHTLKQYGLTIDDWNALFDSQGRVCAICGSENPRGKHGVWYTDHNHITGLVRGILCHNCNVGLGNLRGDEGVQTLNKAIQYLERIDGH